MRPLDEIISELKKYLEQLDDTDEDEPPHIPKGAKYKKPKPELSKSERAKIEKKIILLVREYFNRMMKNGKY